MRLFKSLVQVSSVGLVATVVAADVKAIHFVGAGALVVLVRERTTSLVLPCATVITAFVLSAWGWVLSLALLANWLSWLDGAKMRGAAILAWGALGLWAAKGREELVVLSGVGAGVNLVEGIIRFKFFSGGASMFKSKLVFAIVALSLLSSGVEVALAQSADPPQAGDVLFFEGFEFVRRNFDQRIAEGWQSWWDGDAPEYKQANPEVGPGERPYPARVHTGDNAQQYFSVFRTHDAGLYHQVQVPPHAKIEAVAWGSAWSAGHDDPCCSDGAQTVNMRVGIDPEGGTNPNAGTVVWSGEINPMDAWQSTSVVATAGAGGNATIFLRSTPNYPLKHNDVYWDDVTVTLVEMGQPPKPAVAAAASSKSAGSGSAVTDPILSGLTADQQSPQSGGSDLLPAILLSAVVAVTLAVRKGVVV